MSMASALKAALYGTISAASSVTSLLAGTASVYHLKAPEGASLAYVVYNVQGGGNVNQTPHEVKNMLLFIRGYSRVDAVAGSIDDALYALLHRKPISISGWSNLWIARQDDMEGHEIEPTGDSVFMSGGIYRLLAEKTS